MEIKIDSRIISKTEPCYFIADIAANHDGDIQRAIDLIYKCAEAGADAAKFQHFDAKTIVSDLSFNNFSKQISHQKNWKKSVFEVYQDATVSQDWTRVLKETCDKAGITFLSTPYSKYLVDHIENFVPAYKIGSGDITWLDLIDHIAKKNKPVLLATGASSFEEVQRACEHILAKNKQLILMQCNTNYTASLENFKYINLNVLRTYQFEYPDVILGLSDHTPGSSTVLGAVALGAKVIEKHFTDDNTRDGPDHKFAMNPITWREMVERTRELELAMGNGKKTIEANELDSIVVQRRAIHLNKDIQIGSKIKHSDLKMLRPCPKDGFSPYHISYIVGKVLLVNKKEGDYVRSSDIET